MRAGGPRGGVAAHRTRLTAALAVLRILPAEGIPLAVLSAKVLGDAHGLDRNRSVAALVLDALAAAGGDVRASDAEDVRRLWERAGVVPDPLSSTVLVLGLRPPGDHPTDRWLRAMAEAGEPVVLTLSQLRRQTIEPLAPDAVAHVVENPSLLAEAVGRRWAGPPLVCSSGRPTMAVVTLLRQLGRGAPRSFSTPTSTRRVSPSPHGCTSGPARSRGAWMPPTISTRWRRVDRSCR